MANVIQAENAIPGSRAYLCENGVTSALEISAYFSLASVNKGDPIALKVKSPDSDYTVQFFRIGYYQALGGRSMGAPITLPAQAQPAAFSARSSEGTGQSYVECNWATSYTLTVPQDWVSGAYVAKLTRVLDGKQYLAKFIVRDDSRTTADVMFVFPDFTEQNYNDYGGRSSYVGSPASRRVSFDRPHNFSRANQYNPGSGNVSTFNFSRQTVGSGRLFRDQANASTVTGEHAAVMWLEAQGYDVRYASQVDRATRPAMMMEPRVLLTAGHDEYWALEEFDVIKARLAAGKHCVELSGNTAYWTNRLEKSTLGIDNRRLATFKENTQEDFDAPIGNQRTGYTAGRVVAGITSDPAATVSTNDPEEKVLGLQWSGGGTATGTVDTPGGFSCKVANASDPMWTGVGITGGVASGVSNGTPIGGIVGHEFDNSWTNNNLETRFNRTNWLPLSSSPNTVNVSRRHGAAPPATFVSLLVGNNNATAPDASVLFDAGYYKHPTGNGYMFHGGADWFALGLAQPPYLTDAGINARVSATLQKLMSNALAAMGVVPGTGTPAPVTTVDYEGDGTYNGVDWTPLWSRVSAAQADVALTDGDLIVRHRSRNVATNEYSPYEYLSLTIAAEDTGPPAWLDSYYQLAAAGGLGTATGGF